MSEPETKTPQERAEYARGFWGHCGEVAQIAADWMAEQMNDPNLSWQYLSSTSKQNMITQVMLSYALPYAFQATAPVEEVEEPAE